MTRYPAGRFADHEAALLAVAVHHLDLLAFQADELRGEFRPGAVAGLLDVSGKPDPTASGTSRRLSSCRVRRQGCQVPAVQLCREQVPQFHHPVEAERGTSVFKMDDVQAVAGTEVVWVYGDFVLFHGDLLKTLPPTGVSVRYSRYGRGLQMEVRLPCAS